MQEKYANRRHRLGHLKEAAGNETHRTFKMRTPHLETHVMCNNHGPAMSAGGKPNDSKMALMNRTISYNMRSVEASKRR